MLKTEALIAWLKAHTAGVPAGTRWITNRLPAEPSTTIVAVREIEAPVSLSNLTEEAFDNAAVQVRVRGPKNDAEEARDLAHAIDRALKDDSLRPLTLGGHHVPTCGRLGGPPVHLLTDNLNRASYVCNYWFLVER